MVDRRRPKDEDGHVRRHFLPAIVLDDLPLVMRTLRARISWLSEFLREFELGVRDARRPNLERFAHKLVLRVDLAVVIPCRRFCPAGRDWRVMADLFGYVAVLLVQSNIFKRFALNNLVS